MPNSIEPAHLSKLLHAIEVTEHPSARAIKRRAFVRSHIPSELLQRESLAQSLAWCEYRYEDPLARSQRFAEAYFDAFARNYPLVGAVADAEKKKPIARILFDNDVAVIRALWRARIEADMSGAPYDVYLDRIMREHVLSDKAKRLPLPNQLYGKLALPRLRGLPDENTVRERLCGTNWDDRFKADKFTGDPVQLDVLKKILDLVKGSSEPVVTLGTFLCDRRALSVEVSEELFGSEVTLAAMQKAEGLPVPTSKAEKKKFAPGCFGFSKDQEQTACQSCTVRLMCGKLSAAVTARVKQETGYEDPISAEARRKNKSRQQAWRDRQKKARIEGALQDRIDEQSEE